MNVTASVVEIAAAIRSKEVSPLEVLDETLERVDQRNPGLNAVIWRNDDEARSVARAIGDRIARGEPVGPFAGVPLPVKDLASVAGQPIFHGSTGASGQAATETEPAIQHVIDAGFVLAGRTNSPEFGSVSITENDRFGATRNPWNPEYTPGGSSGGAAAAVASGMFAVAHASDGGGSIRIPASCCGLVGHKPSRGLVPDTVPLWSGLSTEGALTRSVADAAAMLDVMSRPDPYAWWSQPRPVRPFVDEVGADPGRLRVALSTVSALGLVVAPEAVAAVERTGVLLESLGHHVVRLHEDVFDPSGLGSFLTILDGGLAGYSDIDWDAVEPHNRASRAVAESTGSVTFNEALMDLQRQTRPLLQRFDDEFDLLVTPTMACEPPPVGLLADIHSNPDVPVPEVIAMAAFTAIFNISGQPAISLPVHVAASGLPVGVQLVAGAFRDAQLLRVAAQVEAATPWDGRLPLG